MGCAGRSPFYANAPRKLRRRKASAPAQPKRHFRRAPGERQQKREIAHGAACLIEACPARLKAHAHRTLRDDEGGVLVKGAAHGEYKNKTRTIWQVKNSIKDKFFFNPLFLDGFWRRGPQMGKACGGT
jgi:hypothetical protein